MRTTVTFEDDVAALVKQRMRASRIGLKQLINDALRLALTEGPSPSRRKRPVQRTADCGEPLIPIDNVWEAIAIAEGENFK